MTPREELDLILKLIRKYNLPLSPILEYAVNEKKDEFPEVGNVAEESVINPGPVVEAESATIGLTRKSVKKPSKSQSSYFFNGTKTYKDIATSKLEMMRFVAVLNALEHFKVPATPRDVARTVSRSAWGGTVREDSVDSILKRLPEVEYVPWGKYILKTKKK